MGCTRMPCYLFTYHTYGSWMPDRPQGYVRRHEGALPSDTTMAIKYRTRATQELVRLTAGQQLASITAIKEAALHIGCHLHLVATDPTHIHVLVSWQGKRTWQQNRTSLKRSVTLRLKSDYGNQAWLANGSSRRRVVDHDHFDHLVTKYLPSHRGWKWCEERGLFR